MNKRFALCSFLFLTIAAHAQKEAWNWYFGANAGIGFGTGSAVFQTGSLSTYEGVASISDSSGNLLFYTDGKYVYDNTHAQMPNGFGLFGDPSSTQSSIIVRLPGSYTIYYIFTVDYNWNGVGIGNGFCYSIVDMTLNGGYGDVTTKNFLVRLPVYEKLTAVKHGNNSDYWILINDWQGDDIYSYLFTSAGLNLTPVASGAGPFHNLYAGNTAGYFKANRQGNRVVLAMWEKKSFDLCDFDNLTGIASNHLVIQSNDMVYTYGAEFSPDGTLLYGTNMNPPCHLYQFDLSSGTAAGILSSRVTLHTSNGLYYYSGLQIAPDGKIYVAHRQQYYLGTIENPDSLGALCNYIDNSFSLNNHLSWLGLPNYPADYFNSPPTPGPVAAAQPSDTVLCQETCISFTDLSTNNPTSWQWYFPGGGPSSSTMQNPPSICYSQPGTYDVTLIVSNANGTDTLVMTNLITVSNPPPDPVVVFANDTFYCTVASNYFSYQWFMNSIPISGATDATYYPTAYGTYHVEAYDSVGCLAVSIPVTFTRTEIFSERRNQLTLFPNPSTGKIQICSERIPKNENVLLMIYNSIGQIMREEKMKWSKKWDVDVSSLPDGCYVVKLQTASGTFRTNFLKK